MNPSHHHITCPNYPLAELDGVGEHELHYVQWGEGDKVAVCVHGLTRNARDFDLLAQQLVVAGYRVIAVDVIGRGKSAWLTRPEFYTYPLYVADLCHVLDSLELQQVDWVGTSMGGLIGLMVAALRPELIGRMVLNDIGPHIPGSALMRIGAAVGQDMVYPDKDSARAGLKDRMTSFGITQEAHWRHLFDHGMVPQEDGSYHLAYDPRLGDAFWNNRGKQRNMTDMSLWELWDPLTLPTLVLRGEESDLLLPDTLAQMAQKPTTETITFNDVGHAPMLMEPAQITPVVSWLTS